MPRGRVRPLAQLDTLSACPIITLRHKAKTSQASLASGPLNGSLNVSIQLAFYRSVGPMGLPVLSVLPMNGSSRISAKCLTTKTSPSYIRFFRSFVVLAVICTRLALFCWEYCPRIRNRHDIRAVRNTVTLSHSETTSCYAYARMGGSNANL